MSGHCIKEGIHFILDIGIIKGSWSEMTALPLCLAFPKWKWKCIYSMGQQARNNDGNEFMSFFFHFHRNLQPCLPVIFRLETSPMDETRYQHAEMKFNNSRRGRKEICTHTYVIFCS